MDFDVAYTYFENIAEPAPNGFFDILLMFLVWMILSCGLLLIMDSIIDFFKKRDSKNTSQKTLDKLACLATIASFIIPFYISSFLSEYWRLQIKYQDFLDSPFYNSLHLPEKDFAKQQLTLLIQKNCSPKCQQGEHKLLLSDVSRILANIQNSNTTIPSYQDMILLEKSLTNNGSN